MKKLEKIPTEFHAPPPEGDDAPSNGFVLTSLVRNLADDGMDRLEFFFGKIWRILLLP